MKANPRFWSGQRVCVTGGVGFLGYHIVQQLLQLGAHVRALSLRPTRWHPLLHEKRVELIFGDVRDADAVRRAVAGCDTIFHTAAVVATWGPALEQMHAVHIDGTRHVCELAPPNARIVHTSSLVAVNGCRKAHEVTEDSPFELQPLRVDYVQSKRAAEQIALAAASAGRHVVITNPGYLVGPDDYGSSAMGQVCKRFWRGRILLIPACGGFNFADVRDVANAHLLAAEHGQPGRRYLLGGENRTLRDFLTLLAQTAGLRPRALPSLPSWLLLAVAGLAQTHAWFTGKEPIPSLQEARLNHYYWYCRSDRAECELGYRCRPLSETVKDTYAWYEAQSRIRLRGVNAWWMRPTHRAA